MPRRLRRSSLPAAPLTLVTSLAAVAAVAIPAVPAAAQTSTTTRTYAASTAAIANPDRGLYHYTETHSYSDGSGWTPLSLAQLSDWRTQQQVTVVYRIVYLEKYVWQDQLDSTLLQELSTDFATARSAGVRLILRFAYSADSAVDAPPARVVGHIEQLAPVLNAASDVILALQAGFIGRWGEWYYSTSFASDQSQPWQLTATDWANRGQVLNALITSISTKIPLQVRYPQILQQLVPVDSPAWRRIGVHDDCFLADDADMGTYKTAQDRTWLQDHSTGTLMTGETCAVDGTHSEWPNAQTELAANHWTALNADYDTDVLNSWGSAGLATAAQRLGYRLRLTSAKVTSSGKAGAPVSVTMSMANDGYAAPLRHRTAYIAFTSTSTSTRTLVSTPIDVTSVQPGTTSTWQFTVPAPATAGTYSLGLALPDPTQTLRNRSPYAIRLASGTWNSSKGTNNLGISLSLS